MRFLYKTRKSGLTKSRLRFRRLSTVLATVFGTALIVGTGFQVAGDDDLFKLRKNFETFGALYEQLVLGYVDELDAAQVMNRGISAMLADLDPYTVYSDQSQQVSYAASKSGYVQVGLSLGVINENVTVLEPSSDASAYKQGVKVGDKLQSVNGRSVDTISLSDVQILLQGEPGSTVEVEVNREGSDDPITFVLTRQQQSSAAVPLAEFLHGDESLGIGYIKLTSFPQNSHREFRKSLNQLRETGNLKAVVIDLRDNLGGYVDAAVAIAEMFVPKGSTVLTMRGRMPNTARTFTTALDPIDGDVPVIVLMNKLSASASEILAGAIQDLDRGVIVGTPSFGKGLVQTVQALPHNSALKLTIARYYTPSGRSIQAIDYRAHDGSPEPVPDSLRTTYKTANGRIVKDGRGIEPDVQSSPLEESEIEQALKRQSAFFFFANLFAAENQSMAADFEIDDAAFQQFKTWLSSREFEYRSSSDEALEELVAALRRSGYTNDESIEAFRTVIRAEKERDLDRYREQLERHLRDEIAARLFEQPDQIRSRLFGDPDIETAIELVRDKRKYEALLK